MTAPETLKSGFGSILVPLDGSPGAEHVLPVAIEEARLHGAQVVALRIVPFTEPPPGHPSHGPEPICSVDPPGEISDACGECQRYVDDLIRRWGREGDRAVVRYGDPFTQIAAELANLERPLVVLASFATAVLPIGMHSELARRIVSLNTAPVMLIPAGSPHHETTPGIQ